MILCIYVVAVVVLYISHPHAITECHPNLQSCVLQLNEVEHT